MSVQLPPFQVLLDQHGPGVHRFLVSVVGPVDAADCFQETMLAALRSYPSLRHADNLRGWLYTIAYNKATDLHRDRARLPIPVEAAPEHPAFDRPVDGDGGLWDAVDRLPVKQRAAVTCRYVLDLPYREVGAVVGCSEAAARQNVRAGLRALRKEVA
jgi:RNA polymerase sigma factor (sigma-70 family)